MSTIHGKVDYNVELAIRELEQKCSGLDAAVRDLQRENRQLSVAVSRASSLLNQTTDRLNALSRQVNPAP